ncbi:hypothetical protein ACHAWO_004274 [Cyclotella atomus]|uniref:Uncharacterized protein n=1 Tax=Cyclotella atomus TaxID=382360 RepID=A0ABD3Q754_9STRA
MLRYYICHKKAAESVSFRNALNNDIPIIVTTTRWNRLQTKHLVDFDTETMTPPTTTDCIKFALQHPAVNIVLHSSRDEDELDEALQPLIERCLDSGSMNWLSHEKYEELLRYGSDEVKWNTDSFDEHPEELQW